MMKKWTTLGIVALIGYFGVACQDITVGYLSTEYAGYSLDSLVIRTELDASPGELNPEFQTYLDKGFTPTQIEEWFGITERINTGPDYTRVTYGIPWTGTPIEGVEGSAPIWCTIKSVTSVDGNADKLKACISVRGNGVISVPLKHDVPPGRYMISLNFRNEGWSKDLDNCFTVIVR